MTNDETADVYDEDILGNKEDAPEMDTPEPSTSGDDEVPSRKRSRLTGARALRVAHRVAAEMIRTGMQDSGWSAIEGFSPEENREIMELVTKLADQHSFRST